MRELAIVGMLCRTSDRTDGGARGAEALARMLAERAGQEPRLVGTPSKGRVTDWSEDIRESRGCILEAGGQVEDALSAGRFPVITASDCSICMTTLPTVVRMVDGVKILWLDAHGDFNTPDTTPSGFLGGMCLAEACSRWDGGFGGGVDPAQVLIVGARDLDAGERAELDLAGVTRFDRPSEVADAVDGAPVYVHLDLDVLDPDLFPPQFAVPGGLSDGGLRTLLAEVAESADVLGVEITAFEAPEDENEAAGLAELMASIIEPLISADDPE